MAIKNFSALDTKAIDVRRGRLECVDKSRPPQKLEILSHQYMQPSA